MVAAVLHISVADRRRHVFSNYHRNFGVVYVCDEFEIMVVTHQCIVEVSLYRRCMQLSDIQCVAPG